MQDALSYWAGRWPLIDLAVGALSSLLLGLSANVLMDLPVSYSVWVMAAYTLLAMVILLAWQRPAQYQSFHSQWWGAVQVHLGWANRVTLARALLVVLVAGMIPFPRHAHEAAWLLALLSLVALCLDGVDGWVARRTGTATAWGARFDMEVDAAFIMVLSVMLVVVDRAGWWVLTLGLMRYGFLLAGLVWHWVQRPLPPSFRRQAVCVVQVASLLICLPPLLPPTAATALLLVAMLLLIYSFAVDLWWLFRHRHQPASRTDRARQQGVDNAR